MLLVLASDPVPAEALAFARVLADELGEQVEAVVFGEVRRGLADELGERGVARVHRIDLPSPGEHSPELRGAALAQLSGHLAATAVVAAAAEPDTEIMAHAAARMAKPLATNCIALTRSGTTGWTLTRLRQGGLLLEDAELTAETALVTVAPGAVADPGTVAAAAQSIVHFEPQLDGIRHSRLDGRSAPSGGVSLATARVVVSGGRGVGGPEGFAPLEELAKLTGGAVGCSRVATNNGWRPHSDQVGQTGTKVSPELYIACGISGATQHWVGCMSAKRILAVNTDPDAPLVNRADYAVIGDVAEVLPAVVEEIHRRSRRP